MSDLHYALPNSTYLTLRRDLLEAALAATAPDGEHANREVFLELGTDGQVEVDLVAHGHEPLAVCNPYNEKIVFVPRNEL